MVYKRYSAFSRRLIIIPSIFLFILSVQHLFFAAHSPTGAPKRETLQIQGEWKNIRRELGLPALRDEIMLPLGFSDSTHHHQRPQRAFSRFFKRDSTSSSSSASSDPLPELFFAPDALEEPKVSYEELIQSLQQMISRENQQRNAGRKGRKKLNGELVAGTN